LGAIFVLQSNSHIGYERLQSQALLQAPLQLTKDAKAFVRLSETLTKTLPPDSTIAIDRAGTLPYFMANYRFIDVLGKADPIIAREKSRQIHNGPLLSASTFIPGHTKWDPAYSLGRLNPDIVILTISLLGYDEYLQLKYHKLDLQWFTGTLYVHSNHYKGVAPKILESH
jgi:hypothetical protein